jgi:predicted  nucleic acid-binding Zn-ribbon protein
VLDSTGSPDVSNGHQSPPENRTLVALAEGVAELRAEVSHLKDDTKIIRQKGHDVDNRMQEFIAAERLNASNVGKLIEAQAVTNTQIANLASGQKALSDTVQALLLAKSGLEGAWKATLRIGALTVVLVGAAAWAWEHLLLSVKP